MLSTYIPGFTNMLMQPEYTGGPARMTMPTGVLPSAPPIMAAPAASVVPSAPPIMAAPAAAPTPSAPYIPAVTPQLREASYTPQDMMNAGLLSERTMEPSEEFRRADPSFTRKISDINPYYTDPATGFFYNPDASRVGQYFTTNRGGAATAKGASGFAEFNPNFEYRLVDKASGNVVYSGMGAEGLTGVQGAARQFAQEQGDQGDWAVEQFDPATGQATTVARDTKPSNIVGKIADIALPVAAGFIPGVGPVLGAALGSAASSVAQGRSLKDTLMRAGLSAGGAYAGGQLLGGAGGGGASSTGGLLATGGVLPTVGGGFSATLGGTAGGALGSAAGQLGNEIIVSGARQAAGSALGGALSGAAGAAGGSALGSALAPKPTPTQPQQPVEITPEGNLILTGTRVPPPTNIVTGALPGLAAGAPGLVYGGPDGQLSEIISEKPRLDPETAARTEAAAAAAAANNLLPSGGEIPSGQTPTDGEATLETEKGVLDKLQDRLGNLSVVDYLRLAGVALPLLDGLGGGGRSGLSTIPSGLFGGGGSGVFGGGLPTPTLPGVSTGFAPRTAADLGPKATQDWYRYGYGPEQSFFSYVPQGEENKSQAYTGYALGGMAGGGMRGAPSDSFAVNGPGTGRSDEIPAMLSDGEYVIDAETVALLGDGSSKAGADRLDQFRANVRKHKGRHLAKGDFSVNAKRPEQYLKGGRT